ncbi:MAG: hypothetical protein QGD94_03110, partial [Planctomycetia bacterium]|nr:hypothetical protein [Planctomycetia bacterium]
LKVAPQVIRTRQVYPLLEPIVRKKGLVELGRALLRHPDSKLRILGLLLASHHRLSMLKAEIMDIIADKAADKRVREIAMLCISWTGIPLEDVLAGVEDVETKLTVIMRFSIDAPAVRIGTEINIGRALIRLMDKKSEPIEVRWAAWLALAGKYTRARSLMGLSVSDEAYWRWADADYPVQAVIERRPADAVQRLLPFLKSPDRAVRVRAAYALTLRLEQKDKRGVAVLVDCLPHFDTPMEVWVSVGFLAYNTLAILDEGRLISIALDGLSQEEKKVVAGHLGEDFWRLAGEERTARLGEFFDPRNQKVKTKAKNEVAEVIANWWRPKVKRLQWYVSTPSLKLIYAKDKEPPETPEK